MQKYVKLYFIKINSGKIVTALSSSISNKIIRVFPKIDHSARSGRIVLAEYTTGSVVELKFCQRLAKDFTRFW